MVVKWIVCYVSKEKKDKFCLAQEEWKALKEIDGFIFQIGGWDLKNNSNACILGVWEDFKAYSYFMDHVHDQIFYKHNQKELYDSSSVALFEVLVEIPGAYKKLYDSLEKGRLLRVADTMVYDNQERHFEKVQKEIWNPGMGNASGMCSGAFSKMLGGSRYLVTTLWKDENSHQKYVETIFPILRDQSGLEKDIKLIQGKYILLEEKWTVTGKGRSMQ